MMDSIVTFINDGCTSLKTTLTTLLAINYVIGECAVALFKYVCQAVIDLVHLLCTVISILLEDFGTFLEEIGETTLVTFHGIVAGVENIFYLIHAFFHGLYQGATHTLHSLNALLLGGVGLVLNVSDLIGKSLYLTFSNVTKGIFQIPATFLWSLGRLHAALRSLLETVGDTGSRALRAVAAAPVETVLGLFTFALFSYLFCKTATRLIHDHQISRRHIARWSFKGLCLVYVFFVNLTVGSIRGLARLVEFTLSHLHVPRFHQAGDSDEEDNEGVDPDVIPNEALDDSDAEAEARMSTRRRNYDLLIQRRNDKRSTDGIFLTPPVLLICGADLYSKTT